MLRDAPRLAGGDIGRSQCIEQRRLAVIDVTHDGHDRRPRFQFGIGVGDAFQTHFHVGFRNPSGAMAELLHHQFGSVGVERLRRCGHDAHLHQRLDDIAGAGSHAVAQLLHSDCVGQDNVTHNFHLIGTQTLEFGLTTLAFALTPHRGK